MAGTLFLVVGPSGAGKDTLMEGALAARPDLVAARRVVTRPEDAPGEDADAETPEGFAARAARGEFLLHWQAHGLSYAIPASVTDDLAAGRDVLANISRAAVGEAQRRVPGARVILVTAAPAIRAARLAGRGRETAAEIEARLQREGAVIAPGPGVSVVENAGSLEDGIAAFLRALQPVSA